MSFRRNKAKTDNCPECGIFVCKDYQKILYDITKQWPEEAICHKCDESYLKRSATARDASMRRDPDDEAPKARSFGQRLAEGFELLNLEDVRDRDDE